MKLRLLAIAIVLICAGAFGLYAYDVATPSTSKNLISIQIPAGTSATKIADLLKSKGVLRRIWTFRLYVKLHGYGDRFQVGTFELPTNSSIRQIVDQLVMPQEAREKVVRIVEGWTLREIADELVRQGFGTKEEFFALTGKPATDFRKDPAGRPTHDWKTEFPILTDKPADVSLEGYLFPDTYRFATDAKMEDAVRRLLQEFSKKFTVEMVASAKSQNRSVFDIVTLASVVEREVQLDADRRKVSDIFWRRVDSGWGLQADSTVNYITQGTSASITLKETETESPYNTYKYRGLPFGPISNPGLACLQGTLNPDKNNFWFYLTTPTGEVKYARTFEEHVRNRRYLK